MLSTMSGSPASCATSATAATSRIFPSGLEIVSPNSSLVFGRIAARHCSTSAMSSTNVVSMPSRFSVYLSRLYVPPYSAALETTWSPAAATLRIANVVADCPEASSSAPTPPSRAAIRAPTACSVGLPSRV